MSDQIARPERTGRASVPRAFSDDSGSSSGERTPPLSPPSPTMDPIIQRSSKVRGVIPGGLDAERISRIRGYIRSGSDFDEQTPRAKSRPSRLHSPPLKSSRHTKETRLRFRDGNNDHTQSDGHDRHLPADHDRHLQEDHPSGIFVGISDTIVATLQLTVSALHSAPVIFLTTIRFAAYILFASLTLRAFCTFIGVDRHSHCIGDRKCGYMIRSTSYISLLDTLNLPASFLINTPSPCVGAERNTHFIQTWAPLHPLRESLKALHNQTCFIDLDPEPDRVLRECVALFERVHTAQMHIIREDLRVAVNQIASTPACTIGRFNDALNMLDKLEPQHSLLYRLNHGLLRYDPEQQTSPSVDAYTALLRSAEACITRASNLYTLPYPMQATTVSSWPFMPTYTIWPLLRQRLARWGRPMRRTGFPACSPSHAAPILKSLNGTLQPAVTKLTTVRAAHMQWVADLKKVREDLGAIIQRSGPEKQCKKVEVEMLFRPFDRFNHEKGYGLQNFVG
ncbi:hypothetical protein EJ05DRAFT_505506 [Pseudovirgaria hyperparasitica]|uniref:Uncharacterized protein n=1 Tax=Pseudovirgaria hyperparasitica TaxID=470096 RepID=A0A6A6VQN2_9PEZI|nr:uncharacterized protein EJ05DRAFT_505506 [Pseudovirgaria hyperparasitica]KAF2752958.1 hypothetical protein EJ05DRAFT_505506 [Pseudovirgaria hyperparasitica]